MYPLNEQETKYQQLLASANNFTLEDLEANRGGRITDGQLAKLKRNLYTSLGCTGLVVLVGLSLLLGGIGAALSGSDSLVGGVVMLVVGLLFVSLGLFAFKSNYGHVKEPRLLSYEGIVLKHEERRNFGGGCLVVLVAAIAGVDKKFYYRCDNGVRFKVSKAAHDLLVESETYDVYYARGGVGKFVPLSIGLIPVEVTRKRKPGAPAAGQGAGKAATGTRAAGAAANEGTGRLTGVEGTGKTAADEGTGKAVAEGGDQ
ncbi:MAG TPA: hypothetical protein VE713_00985 [Pyrinomonadaceae bacterium]|nr:hypothetical protein [Pyrinomonadaceae bacterium]